MLGRVRKRQQRTWNIPQTELAKLRQGVGARPPIAGSMAGETLGERIPGHRALAGGEGSVSAANFPVLTAVRAAAALTWEAKRSSPWEARRTVSSL